MIDQIVEIIPADTGKFRNVSPKAVEDMLRPPSHTEAIGAT